MKRFFSITALLVPVLFFGVFTKKEVEALQCPTPQAGAAAPATREGSSKFERVYHLWCGGTF